MKKHASLSIPPAKVYQPPPAPFKPKQLVLFDGDIYEVEASTHTHTQLEGIDHAVANWHIKPIRKKVGTKKR